MTRAEPRPGGRAITVREDSPADIEGAEPAEPRPRGWLDIILAYLVAWPLVLAATALVAVRFVGPITSQWIALALGLLPLAMLPCYPIAVIAGLTRRWILAFAAIAMIAAHLYVLWPALPPAANIPPAVRKAPALSVLSLNLSSHGVNLSQLASVLRKDTPDVLVLVELSTDMRTRLEYEPSLKPYASRYVATDRPDGMGGAGIFSKLPLTAQSQLPGVAANMPGATVRLGKANVRIQAVHAFPPLGDRVTRWQSDLAAIQRAAAAAPGPLILAGDFNATRDHYPFRDILKTGMADAQDFTGSALTATWPDNHRFLPRLMTLDHILSSSELTVLDTAQRDSLGSDHSAVIAKIALTSG